MIVWIYSAPCHCFSGDCRILEGVSHIHSRDLYAWLGLSVITTAAAAVFEESGLLKWTMVMVCQSSGKAESCTAAESWRLQEGVVLVQHTRAWAALSSSSWTSALPQSGVRTRHITSSLPQPPPDSSQSRSKQFVVTNHTDRPLKSERQGWEVEGESTAGKNLIRQLEMSLGNRI